LVLLFELGLPPFDPTQKSPLSFAFPFSTAVPKIFSLHGMAKLVLDVFFFLLIAHSDIYFILPESVIC